MKRTSSVSLRRSPAFLKKVLILLYNQRVVTNVAGFSQAKPSMPTLQETSPERPCGGSCVHIESVERIGHYPIVENAFDTATQCYNKVKVRSKLNEHCFVPIVLCTTDVIGLIQLLIVNIFPDLYSSIF